MAYGLEYWLPFASYFDSSVEVLIKREADSSSETYFTGDGQGTKLQLMHSSRRKFEQVLFGAICTVPLMTRSKTEYDELFTTDNREYMVELEKDGTVFWQGYGEANEHRRNYDNPSWVNIAFVDGLGRLKDIEFNAEETFGWHTPQRLSKIIGYCLYQTGLNLPVREAVNVYETNINSGVGDSMLYQIYQYPRVYEGLSCAEVLKRILKGSVVWQRNNKWYIVRIHELTVNTIYYREWLYVADMMGGDAPDNNNTENLSITLTEGAATARASMNVFINQSKHRDMQGGWKEFTINQHFGRNLNLIKDHEEGFTANGNIEYEVNEDYLRVTNDGGAYGSFDSGDYLQYELGYIEYDAAVGYRRLEISLEGFAIGHLRFSIHLQKATGNPYWLKSDGSWVQKSSAEYFYNNTGLTYIDEEQFSISLNADGFSAVVSQGDLYFRIYEPFMMAGDRLYGNEPYFNLKHENAEIELKFNDEYGLYGNDSLHLEELETLTEISPNNSEVPETIDFYLTDKTTDNDYLVYDSMMYRYSGGEYIRTEKWNRRGASNNMSYLQLLIQEITWQNSEQWAILTGQLVGHFKFGDIVVDTDSKRYFIIDASYSLRYDQWEIVAFEISSMEYLITESGESIIITESTEEPIQ